MSASPFDSASRRPTLRQDERAVSEVIGQIMVLGMMSIILISTMWGFATAKDNATERAVIVRGDALLQGISTTAVQASLFAEEHGSAGMNYSGRLAFPHELEGHSYMVDLDNDEVIIHFPDFATNVSAPLFQAGAGSGITICDQEPLIGGPLRMHLREPSAGGVPPECDDTVVSTPLVLYLETDV